MSGVQTLRRIYQSLRAVFSSRGRRRINIMFKDDRGKPHVFVPKHNLHLLGNIAKQRKLLMKAVGLKTGTVTALRANPNGTAYEQVTTLNGYSVTIRYFENKSGLIEINTAFIP
jgi:hypothetical protein